MRFLLQITLIFSFLLSPLYADWKLEVKKIEFLLKSVETSGAVFIRNGSEHSSKEAADHLRLKLKNAQSGWFFYTPVEEWTVTLFIEKIATKSSLSGKPYKIKTKDGKIILSADWLRKKALEYPSQ